VPRMKSMPMKSAVVYLSHTFHDNMLMMMTSKQQQQDLEHHGRYG